MCVFKRISNSLSSSNSAVLGTFGFSALFFFRLFCSSYLLDYFTIFLLHNGSVLCWSLCCRMSKVFSASSGFNLVYLCMICVPCMNYASLNIYEDYDELVDFIVWDSCVVCLVLGFVRKDVQMFGARISSWYLIVWSISIVFRYLLLAKFVL